jgi:hypothetical protein
VKGYEVINFYFLGLPFEMINLESINVYQNKGLLSKSYKEHLKLNNNKKELLY